ncbi:MAG TPA: hypothetical protein VGP42_02615 [Stellaceae bacterium]|nr:hypothetical protein [Stellaceae bacterium]HJZ16071.1 hypothetical protein [Stellaceae bacterium]
MTMLPEPAFGGDFISPESIFAGGLITPPEWSSLLLKGSVELPLPPACGTVWCDGVSGDNGVRVWASAGTAAIHASAAAMPIREAKRLILSMFMTHLL